MSLLNAAFADAPCVGHPLLWESVTIEDHRQAAELCAACPALNACRELLREELAISHTMRAAGGGPRGTWAGKLIGKPKVA